MLIKGGSGFRSIRGIPSECERENECDWVGGGDCGWMSGGNCESEYECEWR